LILAVSIASLKAQYQKFQKSPNLFQTSPDREEGKKKKKKRRKRKKRGFLI